MKKICILAAVVLLCVGMCSCSSGTGNNNGSKDGEVAVFYYTYSDTYISGVRSAVDKLLSQRGNKYNDYDANANQTTQTEQIQTSLAKGASALIVNVVDTGSNDSAQNIVNLAKNSDIPVIFFNRSVDESVVTDYEKCVFVGTDYEMAGHMQGQMIGEYLAEHFDEVDLNKDGKISYVMFKGQEGNMEAIARTRFGVEDCNSVLAAHNLAPLEFYDASNKNAYLVDQDGLWSSAAAANYMSTILAQYSESNKNMVELVIANNDEMALGAVSSLQSAGYNKSGAKTIPVFGVDATDAARDAIKNGAMAGTIRQDAQGMAQTITTILDNFANGSYVFESVDKENIVGTWRVNIPYSAYTGE